MATKPKYFQEAERLLGMKEISGKGTNAEITSLWADAGLPEVKDDETPWCAAFVNGCLVRGNKASTKSGLARSFKFPEHADKFTSLNEPELYCIGVMKRGNSSWTGHVGFVQKFDEKYVWLLGGNQGDSVSISRFNRSSFSGSGVGFVKPKLRSTDIPVKELKEDSRALKTSSWYQRTVAALTAAGTAAFTFIGQFKTFVHDNAGLMILGVVGVGIVGVKMWDYFTINAYQEGRYLPKAHEADEEVTLE